MIGDATMRFRTGSWARLRLADGRIEFAHDVLIKVRGLGDAAGAVHALLAHEEGFHEPDLSALIGVKHAKTVIAALRANHLIRPFDEYIENSPEQLIHQSQYLNAFAPHPRQAAESIAHARVLVVGVGGIGALVLQHLMGAGVRTVHLVDADVVSPSNMNRQYLFTPDQIGCSKVELAAIYARKFHGASVSLSPRFIDGPDSFDDEFVPDVVVCAADQPPRLIRSWAAEHARRHGAAFIGCGVGINRGYWGPLVLPNRTPCHPCSEGESTGGGEPLAVSFGPMNSMVAAGVAAQAIWAIADAVPTGQLGRRTILNLTEPALRLLPPAVRGEGCTNAACAPLEEPPC